MTAGVGGAVGGWLGGYEQQVAGVAASDDIGGSSGQLDAPAEVEAP